MGFFHENAVHKQRTGMTMFCPRVFSSMPKNLQEGRAVESVIQCLGNFSANNGNTNIFDLCFPGKTFDLNERRELMNFFSGISYVIYRAGKSMVHSNEDATNSVHRESFIKPPKNRHRRCP